MDTRTQAGLDRLGALEARLRDFLAQLGGAQTSIEAIESSWSACAVLTPGVDELRDVIAGANSDERSALRTRLENVTRLNAIASQAARRQRDSTRQKLESTRDTQTSLRNLEYRGSIGESCDISG